ncbi:hypothetical protein AVEN_117686-1 [Araneus ventricosus]|uniref:RNase H type-1 domain-containing protein n=1 Tax=Araneus ventricosus TaxID=182803 RepID=A0A4Y2P370_ARAVE|nr:hypothetical protein AVEN_117686-1 [Araneus ventricosus]
MGLVGLNPVRFPYKRHDDYHSDDPGCLDKDIDGMSESLMKFGKICADKCRPGCESVPSTKSLLRFSFFFIEEIRSPKVKSNFVLSDKDIHYNAKDLVSLVWVQAHAGNPSNELADHFAKTASSCGVEMSLPAPYSYAKNQKVYEVAKEEICYLRR